MSSKSKNNLRDLHHAEYILHKKDHCERCNLPSFKLVGDYKVFRKLTVHHKDRNVENNSPEKLETLCRKCHDKEHKNDPANKNRQRFDYNKINNIKRKGNYKVS